MRNSSRLVSVVFSYFALLSGLVALPTAGQSAPLTVLNWIPPNSFVPPTTLESLNGDGLLVSGSKASGTIPMWLCLAATTPSAQCNTTYSFAMVGKNPTVTGSGATQIETKIIPIRFTSASPPLTFDPENNDACSPRRTPALNMVQQSPLFRAGTLQLQKTLGSGQFGSLFQRANFWTYTQPKAASPNYQITLNQVLVNAEETKAHTIALGSKSDFTALPYTIAGQVLTDTDSPSTWCDPVAEIEVNDLDLLLQTIIIPALKGTSGVSPTTLPIFLLSNVVMYDSNLPSGQQCCILGYHNAYFSLTTGATAGKIQTYIVANYDSTGGSNFAGAFPAAPDLVALANMIAGWIDNPTTLNTTPPWTGTINGVLGTQTTLEVAYPPEVAGVLSAITMPNKNTYHVQELAFKSWFYCDTGSANAGFGGSYSLNLASTALSNPNLAACP
jgi:hypothetical protein